MVLLLVVLLLHASPSRAPAMEAPVSRDEGIRLRCPSSQQANALGRMAAYLSAEGVAADLVRQSVHADRLVFTLATPAGDTTTLDFQQRPEYGLADVTVALPAGRGKLRRAWTISRREILLALMQHGRVTEFNGADCGVAALQDQVLLRQNVVAWAWSLSWVWPDGGAAEWNRRYWDRGTPRRGVPLALAVEDAFYRQGRYAIGCYTATKLTLVQAVLDFHRRLRRDPVALRRVERRLGADGDPLVHIEPARLWEFESDFDPSERHRAGKLVTLLDSVAAKNFVPGDWVVFVNTDPVSYAKTGYEGSNALYLGGGRFDDYYNDHGHAYTYEEKLDEVYQWRHGVFSRIRDGAKRRPLTLEAFERLTAVPAAGGLLLDVRAVPMTD